MKKIIIYTLLISLVFGGITYFIPNPFVSDIAGAIGVILTIWFTVILGVTENDEGNMLITPKNMLLLYVVAVAMIYRINQKELLYSILGITTFLLAYFFIGWLPNKLIKSKTDTIIFLIIVGMSSIWIYCIYSTYLIKEMCYLTVAPFITYKILEKILNNEE